MKVGRVWQVLLALVLACLPWLLNTATTPAASTLLQQARFGATLDDADAQAVSLPHRWHEACAECRTAWYHFDIPLSALAREPQAVYLADVADNAAVYLNGRLLGSGGSFTDPVARLGARAMLLPAPQSFWVVGPNRLYVLVKAEQAVDGRMAAPALAQEATLLPLERWRTLLAVTLPQLLATAAVVLGLVMGVLWFYRRQQPEYVLLAAAALAWAVWTFSEQTLQPPWLLPWWDGWLLLSLAMASLAWLALSCSLATAWPHHTHRAGLAVLSFAVGLVVAGTVWRGQGASTEVLRSLLLLAWVAAGALLARAGWQQREASLLVPGVVMSGLAAWEAASPWLPPHAWPLGASSFAAALLLGTAAWLLLLRFVQTLNAVELLNIDLEGMVQARTAELQEQFQRVRELERREAIANERERLMRDMHDGVGGHLVSVLAMIEADRRRPGELAEVVRHALEDMRLLVDSLEPVDDDLNAVLAMWHDRLAPRLRVAGVHLQWDVELLPPVPGLSPARVLHLLRILQEAVSNALRHGHARTLALEAASSEGVVRIRLQDSGSGFDAGASHSGRGLKNMRRRAGEAGASLDIRSAPGQGTSVTLGLPLTP